MRKKYGTTVVQAAYRGADKSLARPWKVTSYSDQDLQHYTKITQFLTPTHAQLQRHRLKFIKKPYKNSYMFRSTTIFRELKCPL